MTAAEIDWEAEAALDPAISFTGSPSQNAAAPRHILLTGATGFLGAFLLDELLRKSPGSSTIHCLIRDDDARGAAQRLRSHLEKLGLHGPEFDARVVAVPGNLAMPRLGLKAREFDELAQQVDVIYHNASEVNFVRPYSALKPTNVIGTHEVLRLAGHGQIKPVHFVSTMAVFFGKTFLERGLVSELDTPVRDIGLRSGYAQSKWVAEQLILAARARGLPSAIYRPTRITGHSRTGATSSWNDLLNSFLKGCLILGAYPALDIDIPMVPVDYISQAIVHLSRQPDACGRAFHFFQPRPIPWSELIRLLIAAGYPMTELPFEAWRQSLRQAAASHHDERPALLSLLSLLQAPNYLFVKKPRYEAPNLQAGLADSGIACPPVDAALIGAYLAFFQARRYLPSPRQTSEPRNPPVV